MDPYERLAAINEEIRRLKVPHRVQKKKQTRKAKEISQAIDRAGNSTENYKKVAARLAAHYDNLDNNQFGDSAFGKSIHDSFDPSKDPNAEADQEFDNAAQALRDAGIAYKALKRIGSLRREKDIFKVNRRDMRQAREVMQDFPNTQIKRA